MKQLYANLIGLGLLAACGPEVPTHEGPSTSYQTKDVISPDAGIAILGQGYDSHSESFRSRCADYTDHYIYAGTPQAEVRFDKSLSHEELLDILDVNVSGKMSYGAFNAKGAATFATEAASSNLSESLVFVSQTRGRSVLMDQAQLTRLGRDAAASGDSQAIRTDCGDQFVRRVDLGSQLLINVKFEFANQDIKANFEAEIDFDYLSLFSVAGAAKVASEKYHNNIQVAISALQIGGKVQELNKALAATSDGDGLAIVNCDFAHPEACQKALSKLIKYATTNYVAQIANLDYNIKDSTAGAAFLGYEVVDYYGGGLRELYPNPSPVLASEIQEARDRLALQYSIQSAHRRRAEKLKGMRLSHDEERRISRVASTLQDNVAKIVRTAQTCYEFPLRCVATEAALTLGAYNAGDLSKTLVFYDYCMLQDVIKPRLKKTVAAISDLFGASSRDSCEDIETDLQNEVVIDLAGKDLFDLRPLRNLPKLQALNLANNRVLNLSPLATLPQLRYLNVRHNQISNAAALTALKHLTSLDIAYNRLIDSSDLAKIPNLRQLKMQFNDVRDFSPVAGANFELLYKSLDDICAQERQWLRQQGYADNQTLDAYANVNFVPYYHGTGERSPDYSWVACAAVENRY